MTVSVFRAAREFCEISDWKITNLKIQKLLYLANLVTLGNDQGRLIREDFEAWDYGPVVPELYRQTKVFGSSVIKNIFQWPNNPLPEDDLEAIQIVWRHFSNVPASRLVAITHRKDGAWDKNYQVGQMHINIPDADIVREFKDFYQPERPV